MTLVLITDTTTIERTKAPAADVTSFWHEFSVPTEAFLQKLELEPNIESKTVEIDTSAPSFRHEFVASEPSFWEELVDTQNSDQEYTSDPVSIVAEGS